jgi:hypothetical protein
MRRRQLRGFTKNNLFRLSSSAFAGGKRVTYLRKLVTSLMEEEPVAKPVRAV